MKNTWLGNVSQRMWKDIQEYKWAALAFIAFYLIMKGIFSAFCPMLIVTGLPCPGCGLTRAIVLTLVGEFQRAYNLNPMAFLIVMFAMWFIIERYFLGKRVKGLYLGMGIISVGLIAIYIYRMVVVFPDYPPIVYRRNNIIAEIFPFYEKVIRTIWNF